MSEIKNGRLDLYGAKHLKCNYMMTLGFKGLMCCVKLLARPFGDGETTHIRLAACQSPRRRAGRRPAVCRAAP